MKQKRNRQEITPGTGLRFYLLQGVLLLGAVALVLRLLQINLEQRDFLKGQGNARYLRTVTIPAHRGIITDRNGEPLAISTPVESIWANPKQINLDHPQLAQLAQLLGMKAGTLRKELEQRQQREFYYLSRKVRPELAEKVLALKIPGVATDQEYQRFYPLGEVSAHIVGFTNIDGRGQEGVELMLQDQLQGVAGSKRVLKDRLGNIVENIESIRQPRDGRSIALSIDRRIQYLAYRELMVAVKKNEAITGSAVVIDVQSGEVLALVNYPSYNPHDRSDMNMDHLRNRAVTDIFEPGSTMKPFTVTAALESGHYQPQTPIDTDPGRVTISGFTIRDSHNYGLIDVSGVIQKSSNVGASQIALKLDSSAFWNLLDRVGFGMSTYSGFPGESSGYLNEYQQWRTVDKATLGYGYGISVTALQLTHAYSVLASGGI
ncbi:MAG: penicillin-binding protein 2, partial [Gammaproteobacteria bacterium]|nr:penicillin-binding protein 2 [Gammaproteobacteria bacterium]